MLLRKEYDLELGGLGEGWGELRQGPITTIKGAGVAEGCGRKTSTSGKGMVGILDLSSKTRENRYMDMVTQMRRRNNNL